MNINATLFVEVIIFLGFVALTRRYIWPPLLDIIEQRQKEIQEGIENARQNALLLEETKSECSRMIDEAKHSCQQMHSQAETLIARQLEDARNEAAAQAASILQNAQNQIMVERSKVQAALAEQTEAYLAKALTKILPNANDPAHLDTLIHQALSELADDQEC